MESTTLGRSMAPSEKEWRELLRDCDFAMTRKEIAKALHSEDWQKLGDYLAPQGLLKVIIPFLDTPSLETAIALLQVARSSTPTSTPAVRAAASTCSTSTWMAPGRGE